jgi:RND superfamily putative drug exporter
VGADGHHRGVGGRAVLVALIGLGIAIDYALVVVSRWREERDGGADDDTAVRRAMATAGSAVVFSGTTVAVGLLSAVVLPIPFLRSLAFGGLLTALVSVAVALTLLPVMLAAVGPRADRRRLRRTERAERHWAAWARLVVRRRMTAAAGATAILVALCVVAGSMVLGVPASEPGGTSARADAGLAALERSGIGAAPLWPVEVLTPADRVEATTEALVAVEGVRAVAAPEGSGWRSDGRAVLEVLEVLPTVDTNSDAGRATVDAMRGAAAGLTATGVGGYTAQAQDFVDDVYGSFPLMLGLILLVTFLLLARAFRSVLLPLKAIALNLLSVFATWGVITLVWQHGFGSELLFGADATGAVVEWVPLIVFAFLYGLSMDYEVFILARTREAYDATGSTDEAITQGISRTGRLVTSAALIVFLAFTMLGFAGEVDLQMLATGLAAGVLVDALLVRALLVPALVSLLGRWNWWLPDPARRALRLPREPLPAAQGAR